MVDDEVIRQIFAHYRHLMTESERRADRAFMLQASVKDSAGAAAALRQAESDPRAAELFRKGRAQFLKIVARRVVAEHGHVLPKCSQCGAALKRPSPKQCFACDEPKQVLPGPLANTEEPGGSS